jgi:secretion/DNA translocation related TadE-like protein
VSPALSPRQADRGSATVWVLACCVLLLVVAGCVSIRTLAVLARHRAESAADLAALAAAGRIGVGDDECAAATAVATANAARLARCRVALDPAGRSGAVVVQVHIAVRLPVLGVRSVSASARAGRLPGRGAAAASAPGFAQLAQHQVEYRHGAGLVQRVVAVAALGRLHA